SRLMSVTSTLAPRLAINLLIASPNPEPPPVTSATLLSNAPTTYLLGQVVWNIPQRQPTRPTEGGSFGDRSRRQSTPTSRNDARDAIHLRHPSGRPAAPTLDSRRLDVHGRSRCSAGTPPSTRRDRVAGAGGESWCPRPDRPGPASDADGGSHRARSHLQGAAPGSGSGSVAGRSRRCCTGAGSGPGASTGTGERPRGGWRAVPRHSARDR